MKTYVMVTAVVVGLVTSACSGGDHSGAGGGVGGGTTGVGGGTTGVGGGTTGVGGGTTGAGGGTTGAGGGTTGAGGGTTGVGGGTTGVGGGTTGAGGGTTGAGGGGNAAPAPTVTLLGQPLSYDVFRAIIPYDLAATVYSDGAALDKAGCRIVLWTPVPATGDLDAQALQILNEKFSNFGGIVGPANANPLLDYHHLQGVSGEGWRYVDLQGELLFSDTKQRSGQYVRILLAELGTQVAAMVGWESAPATPCIANEVLIPYDWTSIVYSLSFPGYSAPNPHALRDELVGGWFGAQTGQYLSLAWKDVYAANGRHSDLIGVETYKIIDPTEILSTFSTWQGNGAWAVSGNRLSIWPDDQGVPATTRYFRIFKEYNASAPTGWRTTSRELGLCDGHYCEGWANKE